MELYLQFNMSVKSEKEKCSAFLYLIGQSGGDIYSTMKITSKRKDKVGLL